MFPGEFCFDSDWFQSAVPGCDDAGRRADLVPVQEPVPADPDLLERFLQLRSVRRLPGSHHPGPALPDPVHPAADHLGLLLSAVLSAGGQLPGRTFQEDVSSESSCGFSSVLFISVLILFSQGKCVALSF